MSRALTLGGRPEFQYGPVEATCPVSHGLPQAQKILCLSYRVLRGQGSKESGAVIVEDRAPPLMVVIPANGFVVLKRMG
jgi:hypothetical protein